EAPGRGRPLPSGHAGEEGGHRGGQRVTRDLLDRRGRKTDPTWANRRGLLRGRERPSPVALARMWNGCVDHDPTGQILTAWIAKEELRALCATAAAGGHPGQIRDRVGFQNSAMGSDLRIQAARSYSLISPPSTGRRLIRR